MTELTPINFPRSPMFTDEKKQTFTREWLNFLLFVFKRIGGQSPTIPDDFPLIASRLARTNAEIELRSVDDFTDWIEGIANQLVATDNGSGGVTIGFVDNPTLIKASGGGFKVDLENPTFGWRDLKGKVTQRNTGVSKPTHAVYRGSLRQYQFGVGKEEFFTYHIDHDHVPDSDIFLHVHWSHISGAVTGGSITIEYELAYAKGFNQGAFGAPVSTTFIGTASTVQFQHIISEVQVSAETPDANQIDSNDLEPDGIIEMRVKIDANNMTGATPDPFIHEADIHYQSTNIGTKQREPDFYV
ncbi:hypothetical protein LCGC14_1742470 [marine sediment metagenome]|uniref:Uncharacterized protein n=1 Tax=marine sediment metagenome TaxID=412755 RepID=A0A0F9H674_9ZZZZ